MKTIKKMMIAFCAICLFSAFQSADAMPVSDDSPAFAKANKDLNILKKAFMKDDTKAIESSFENLLADVAKIKDKTECQKLAQRLEEIKNKYALHTVDLLDSDTFEVIGTSEVVYYKEWFDSVHKALGL
ncbi:MAG: hypothetical protein MJZ49_05095 [Bacteroidales bacterium]|nr:hypothetical protein [Bacteroidales bacterium]